MKVNVSELQFLEEQLIPGLQLQLTICMTRAAALRSEQGDTGATSGKTGTSASASQSRQHGKDDVEELCYGGAYPFDSSVDEEDDEDDEEQRGLLEDIMEAQGVYSATPARDDEGKGKRKREEEVEISVVVQEKTPKEKRRLEVEEAQRKREEAFKRSSASGPARSRSIQEMNLAKANSGAAVPMPVPPRNKAGAPPPPSSSFGVRNPGMPKRKNTFAKRPPPPRYPNPYSGYAPYPQYNPYFFPKKKKPQNIGGWRTSDFRDDFSKFSSGEMSNQVDRK